MVEFSRQDQAFIEIGRALKGMGYSFTTPTPETHKRVNEREASGSASTLRDVFGWNRPFPKGALPASIGKLLNEAEALSGSVGYFKSAVRFSTLDDLVLMHSAFPTSQSDAVFLGPDTYRFARCIKEALQNSFSPMSILDVGAGTGAGAFIAARQSGFVRRILLTDVSANALRFSRINAAINDIPVETRESDAMENVAEKFDLILCNPPYLRDADKRLYRHGGGEWGTDLALRIAKESLAYLTPGGKLIFYTGTPIVSGKDHFLQSFSAAIGTKLSRYRYEEVDPDVFGEELSHAPYDKADRIAAVLLVIDAKDIEG